MELNRVYNMDCLDGLHMLERCSVDMVLTDPPYGIGYKSNYGRSEFKKRIHSHSWDNYFNFAAYFSLIWRCLKVDCWMLVFGRIENYEVMKALGCDRVLVWDKNHNGMGDLNDFGIGYELIFVFKKGNPKIRGNRINGVIRHEFHGFFEKTKHPTMKPVKLIELLINKCSDNGDIVLDPFMGSGTTGIAAKLQNRSFYGFEINKNYCDMANRLILDAVPQKKLNIDDFKNDGV